MDGWRDDGGRTKRTVKGTSLLLLSRRRLILLRGYARQNHFPPLLWHILYISDCR